MARVVLSQPGEDVFVGGSDIELFGTNSAGEVITVVTGSIRLDASFNQGGDTVILPGAAVDYTGYRSGSEVIFTRNDSVVTLRIPIGTAGTAIQFDNGDSRTLLFNSATGSVTLDGQALSSGSSAPTALSSGNFGYDVITTSASSVEGDSGTRQILFTITLDRAVAASDGPFALNYRTEDGTAQAGIDYVGASGTVIFAAGQRTATVAVTVNGDTAVESNETLSLVLSDGKLRLGARTLTGTIVNDDAMQTLTVNTDNLQGSSLNDRIAATEATLGAGDRITDASTADNDTLVLTVGSTDDFRTREFAGFALTNIENVVVSNNPLPGRSGVSVNLSEATGLKSVSAVNSSGGVFFAKVPVLADFIVENVTGTDSSAQIYYQAGITAGATAVNLILRGTTDYLSVGTEGDGNRGIETVNLIASGTSTVNRLISEFTTINIGGGGDLTLINPVNTGVDRIDASGAGRVTIDFSVTFNKGVSFIGSPGADVVRSRQATDNLVTGAGDDSVTDFGGNDVIDTGVGDDVVSLLGGGDVTIDTGAGNDVVSFARDQFNGNDKIAFGTGSDTLILAQSVAEADFAGVSDLETLTVGSYATVNLGDDGSGSAAQTAGIRTINIGDVSTLIARDYSAGLTVNLREFGSNTILLGSGADVINAYFFSASDDFQGNDGSDTLNVADRSTVVFDGLFAGIEVINYRSDGDGEDHALVVTDANAPTSGQVLTVNAAGFAESEEFRFISDKVTTYAVNVITGAGGDLVNTRNNIADRVATGAGSDIVDASGGDSVDAGAGGDIISVFDGDNIVAAGDGDDVIGLSGVGDSRLSGDAGDDLFVIELAAYLTSGDTISGGSGLDTIQVRGSFSDEQFTNVTGVEILSSESAFISLGLEAEDGGNGIRTVNFTRNDFAILDASAYTVGLTVNVTGGAQVTTGAGDDIVNLSGTGSTVVSTGAGRDVINGGLGDDLITGGLGKDMLNGGAGADTFRFLSVDDSRITLANGDNRDVIDGFVAGVDKIDLTRLNVGVGQTIRFDGDFATLAEAQAAVASTGNDNFLDVVFARNSGGQAVLFADTDNNGLLDDSDLQIILTNVSGQLTAPDVNNPHLVTGPHADGADQVVEKVGIYAGGQFGMLQVFDSHPIA